MSYNCVYLNFLQLTMPRQKDRRSSKSRLSVWTTVFFHSVIILQMTQINAGNVSSQLVTTDNILLICTLRIRTMSQCGQTTVLLTPLCK